MGTAAAAALGGTTTLLLAPVVLRLLMWARVVDRPNWRSSHRRPVVRGGGLAVAAGIAVALGAARDVDRGLAMALLCTGTGLGLVGLADDVWRRVPIAVRLGVTVVVGTVGVALVATSSAGLSGPGWSLPVALVAVAWVASYVNAFNFMDGIDGISVVQAVVGGVTLALTAQSAGAPGVAAAGWVVAAAAAGFAPLNWPPARLFLGDVGSYFLGGTLALLVVAAVGRGVPLEAAVFPFVLYAADTGVTLVRRMRRGERWWRSHREHTYQRLVDAGWSHGATAAVVGVVCGLSGLLGLVSLTASSAGRAAAVVAVAVLTAGYLSLPSLVAGERRRRGPRGRRLGEAVGA